MGKLLRQPNPKISLGIRNWAHVANQAPRFESLRGLRNNERVYTSEYELEHLTSTLYSFSLANRSMICAIPNDKDSECLDVDLRISWSSMRRNQITDWALRPARTICEIDVAVLNWFLTRFKNHESVGKGRNAYLHPSWRRYSNWVLQENSRSWLQRTSRDKICHLNTSNYHRGLRRFELETLM